MSHIPDGANGHRQCLFLSIHEIQYIYEINNKKNLDKATTEEFARGNGIGGEKASVEIRGETSWG